MQFNSFKISVFALLVSLVWCGETIPQDIPGEKVPRAASEDYENPGTALALLQQAHNEGESPFVLQGELDALIREGGGGACASAVCIDLLQALRVMSGAESLSNPHRVVLSAFKEQPELLDGRVTNEQLLKLIRFYERYIPTAGLGIKVLSAPNSGYRTHHQTWDEEKGPDLSIAPKVVKLISFTVTTRTGKVLGRHFVLLKEARADRITAIDPADPRSDRKYLLDFRPGEIGAQTRLFLNNPPEKPRASGHVFEVNTVFTISLLDGGEKSSLKSRNSDSVEYVKGKLDELANQLEGTADFLNPRVWRKRSAAFGLPGLDLPVEHGGSDWPAVKMVEVFRRAGWHNLNFRDVVGGAHVRPLIKSTNPEVLKILRQVAEGDGYIAIAITEPEAGTDVPSIKSSAKKVDGGYLLSGEKLFNARLKQASHVIIFTQAAIGEPGKLSAFVVPIDAPGIIKEDLRAHGLTGNSFGGISFKNLSKGVG